jgi:hypothetical protein
MTLRSRRLGVTVVVLGAILIFSGALEAMLDIAFYPWARANLSQRLDQRQQPERSPSRDDVDLRRRFHRRFRRSRLV